MAIHVSRSIKGEDVVRVLSSLPRLPTRIKVDNGSEFISKALDKWAYDNGVVLDFSRPGTPTDNAHIESFNGSFRDECLNCHWFGNLEDARLKISRWRDEYNYERPHTSIKNLTPNEYYLRQLNASEF